MGKRNQKALDAFREERKESRYHLK